MASRAVWVVGQVPEFTFTEGDGLFHVVVDIEGLPEIAFAPAVMLKAVIRAYRVYAKWAVANGCKVVSLREMLAEH